MKKVIVIGAGIAGLTCGIYTRMNGFDTEIYELHTIPGGECTGWDRKGYHFDGCLHWLVGSKPGTSLHEIWRDTGALTESTNIIHYEPFARYEEDDAAVNLYTDVNKLEKHLLEIAPEDKREIKRLCADLRRIGSFTMPVDKPMDMMTAKDGITFALKNLRNLSRLNKYNKMTMGEFVQRFQSKLLARALLASIPGDADVYSSIALVSTLASMNGGDSGFPEGGSRALAQRMAKRFTDLGGNIIYKARVDKILVENGKAIGIRLADGKEIHADHIVSCADGYATLVHMLEDKYTPTVYKNLFAHPREYPTVTSALVFMGVDADIPFICRSIEVQRKEPVFIGGNQLPRSRAAGYVETLATYLYSNSASCLLLCNTWYSSGFSL